jgi:hypothetical protein
MMILEQVVVYIEENLGERVETESWPGEGELPLYLRETYDYRVTRIHGRDVLLMVVHTSTVPSPAIIAKQSGTIRERAGIEPVIVFQSLSAYNRKRLVERGISFIVPGNQMYLAPLGIDFRERYRQTHPEVNTVQPATQYTIVSILTGRVPGDEYTSSGLVETLGFSPMPLTRVFRELEALSFGYFVATGRMRHFRLLDTDRQTLWATVLPHLISPVKRTETVRFRTEPDIALPVSGISALARFSDLSEPRRGAVAIDGNWWRHMKDEHSVQEVPPTEETATTVEVWKYPPQLWGETVDPLSLYLSLRDSPDERVQSALERLLERFPW